MQATLITLSAAFLLAGPAPAPGGGSSSPSHEVVPDCLITLIDDVALPTQEAGVLKKLGTPLTDAEGNPVLDADGNPKYLAVREGVQVAEGQVLAQIDDEMERRQKAAAEAKLEVGQLQAKNTVRVDYAVAAAEVAGAELEQAKAANRRHSGAVPAMELTRLKLALKQAELSITQSNNDLEIDRVSVRVREADDQIAALQIERRRILAPFDGMIVNRYVQEDEWVQPGDAVLRIVRMNRLRVEGYVFGRDVAPSRIRIGQRVTVRLEDSQQSAAVDTGALQEPIEGEIVFVSPEIVGDGKYAVWAEVDNIWVPRDSSQPQDGYWLLLPGMDAEMTIDLADAPRRRQTASAVRSSE